MCITYKHTYRHKKCPFVYKYNTRYTYINTFIHLFRHTKYNIINLNNINLIHFYYFIILVDNLFLLVV